MDEQRKNAFKTQLTEYLNAKCVTDLRCFGRHLGLKEPTKLKKQPLIEQIVANICDGVKQTRTKRGAPVKATIWDIQILEDIDALKANCFLENSESVKRKIEIPRKEEKIATAESNPAYAQNTQPVQIVIPIQSCTETQKNLLFEFLKSL